MLMYRISIRKLSLVIILIFQILILSSYFLLQTNENETEKTSVSFLISSLNATDQKRTYHTNKNKLILNTINSRYLFKDFNSSLCYINGTDIKLMERSNKNWKCECLPQYHGADCGQPEVIWRALLANRKQLNLKGPRKYERRLIYIFEVNDITKAITDIRISELNKTIDVFVLYEQNGNVFENLLNYGFLKEYHQKIIYLKIKNDENNIWGLVKNMLGNLRNDDMIILSGYDEIPNIVALEYFKLYDNWPEPVNFRLRWSVFGFFWLHPNKTTLKGSAFTIKYLYDVLNQNLMLINNNKSVNNFIIGDLNHFGGWFCEYCNDPSRIIDSLNKKSLHNKLNEMIFKNINKRTVDANYIEELIEIGVYLDGKTELLRAHRFRDLYFAPTFLTENSWKYDYLMINLYSKMDYYE